MRFLTSINQITETAWDTLWATDYPFVQHRFLRILEDTHCTTLKTGWEPFHLVAEEHGQLVFAMLLYRKHHSYGEYVFDWGWADAFEQAGHNYYPKLLSSVPFTPATGQRMAFSADLSPHDIHRVSARVFAHLKAVCHEAGYSSFHLLFPCAENRQQLQLPWCQPHSPESTCLTERQGHQFHWFNREFSCFDDFLATFSSRKRKNIRRERAKVNDQGVVLRFVPASALTLADWETFFELYHRTYLKRSGRPGYLTAGFFRALGEGFPEQVLICWAERSSQEPGAEKIAAALYFRDDTTLYGRYWGAREALDGLHFEACYYQGIEYAIANGLQRFDPGAQGEHKIQRGFVPVKTCSYHWMAHPQFHSAVDAFVQEERGYNLSYIEGARKLLPFKDGIDMVDENVLL